MRCPDCSSDQTRVVDSRAGADTIRRRRECEVCGARFTTFERVERRQIWVAKRDGTREPFEPSKVASGIALACRKRPIDGDRVEEMVDRVVRHLEDRREATVPSSAVGEAVMEVLREVDEVAYVRFASVYRAFDGVEDFIEAIKPLRGQT